MLCPAKAWNILLTTGSGKLQLLLNVLIYFAIWPLKLTEYYLVTLKMIFALR